MQKEVFENYLGKTIAISLKPNGFIQIGDIDHCFDDCFSFIEQKTGDMSYYDYTAVLTIRPVRRKE